MWFLLGLAIGWLAREADQAYVRRRWAQLAAQFDETERALCALRRKLSV